MVCDILLNCPGVDQLKLHLTILMVFVLLCDPFIPSLIFEAFPMRQIFERGSGSFIFGYNSSLFFGLVLLLR